MPTWPILINICLSALNIILKFFLNIFLANNFEEGLLVKYFTLIDVITLLSIFIVGIKDTMVRAVNNYGLGIYLFFSRIFLSFLAIFLLFFVPLLFFIFTSIFDNFFNFSLSYILLMLLVLMINTFLMDVLLSSRVYSTISYIEFFKGSAFVSIFFLFFLIFYFDNPYIYLILSFVLSNILVSVWIFPKIKKIIFKAKIQNDSNPIKIDKNIISLFFYSFNFSFLEYFCSYLIIYSNSILMIIFFGTENVGDLQVVARPIYLALIAILSFPVFRFLFPEFLNLIKNKRDNELNKARKVFNRLTIFIGLLLIILTWSVSEYFLDLLFPEQYKDSVYFLNILIISIPFVVYTSFLFAIIKSYEHFRATFLIRLLGLIAFIAMSLILYSSGFKEVLFIYSLLFSSLFMFIVAFVYERQIKKY